MTLRNIHFFLHSFNLPSCFLSLTTQHVCSNPDHLALLTEMFPEHSREEVHRVLLVCKGDLDSCSQMLLDHLGPQSEARDTSQNCESMEVWGTMVMVWYGILVQIFSGTLREWLASFPGSPGTRIYIARRAWYLLYVSMTSAK